MSEEEQTASPEDFPSTSGLKNDGVEVVELQYEKYDQNTDVLSFGGSSDAKYMEVVDGSGKAGVLDLLNMTLIKCFNEDGESYRLVPSGSVGVDGETVTCILSNDGEDQEEQFVIMDDQQIIHLQTEHSEINESNELNESEVNEPVQPKKTDKSNKVNPDWILERARQLQKSKPLLDSLQRRSRRGRRRKGELPPPHELLTSPSFKLYLYSCKLCSFKCNAIKELQAHRAEEHFNSRLSMRSNRIALQCPHCPYRGHTNLQLANHIKQSHIKQKEEVQTASFSEAINLDTEEVNAADVLVCGACGFESSSKDVFRKHIEEEHGATAC